MTTHNSSNSFVLGTSHRDVRQDVALVFLAQYQCLY